MIRVSDGAGVVHRLSVAVLVALGAAVALVVFAADGADSFGGGLGGDYPAFHAAGELARERLDAEAFYDPGRQAHVQRELLRTGETGQLYFAYPPFLAAPYALLSYLPYRWAYLLDVVVMVAAAGAALWLLRPRLRVLRHHWLPATAVAASFFPLFRGVTGGQNTALLLLGIAGIWHGVTAGRDGTAGVAAGLLLFKPPVALPFIGGLFLARRYRAVAVAAAVAAGLYAVGALVTDWGWGAAWIDALRFLDAADSPFNVSNFVSLPGAASAVLGLGTWPARIVGYGAAAVVTAVVALLWHRSAVPGRSTTAATAATERTSATDEHGDDRLDLLMAVTAVAALLISPHALYYDAGLLVVAVLVLVDRNPSLGGWTAVIVWSGALTHLMAETVGMSPIVVLLVAVFGVLVREAGGEAPLRRYASTHE